MPLKILVVDDDECIRQAMRYALGPIGEILEAASGDEALRRIETARPRLLTAERGERRLRIARGGPRDDR